MKQYWYIIAFKVYGLLNSLQCIFNVLSLFQEFIPEYCMALRGHVSPRLFSVMIISKTSPIFCYLEYLENPCQTSYWGILYWEFSDVLLVIKIEVRGFGEVHRGKVPS